MSDTETRQMPEILSRIYTLSYEEFSKYNTEEKIIEKFEDFCDNGYEYCGNTHSLKRRERRPLGITYYRVIGSSYKFQHEGVTVFIVMEVSYE